LKYLGGAFLDLFHQLRGKYFIGRVRFQVNRHY